MPIFGASASMVRGIKDKPDFIQQPRYTKQIENARDIPIVIYDTEAQRGFWVDGASALLHLVVTQIIRDSLKHKGSLYNDLKFNDSKFKHPAINGGSEAAVDTLREESNMKHIIHREFSSYDTEKLAVHSDDVTNESREPEAPSSNERKEIYELVSFKDMVCHTWSILEQIRDRQIDVATTHSLKSIQIPRGAELEGYEFMGIVEHEHLLTRRVVRFALNGGAWESLPRTMHAITLFGRCFGNIYKPAQNIERHICADWRTVPRGHGFLAIPNILVQEIKRRSCKNGEVEEYSSEIARGIWWTPSGNVFDTCGPSCQHICNRVQEFISSVPRWLSRFGLARKQSGDFATFGGDDDGAILVGKSSNVKVKVQTSGSRELSEEQRNETVSSHPSLAVD
ncbi:MAG: hypothetical protein M1822_000531 [Bathelium mastoideum]|nr:MAG: hypothetical protein M1822_000531 [Bathelium mastoideum]